MAVPNTLRSSVRMLTTRSLVGAMVDDAASVGGADTARVVVDTCTRWRCVVPVVCGGGVGDAPRRQLDDDGHIPERRGVAGL